MKLFEKQSIGESKNNHRNHSAQNSYISDHVKTLIRVGYAVGTPSTRASSASQTETRKVFSEFNGIIKQKTISRHWRSKLHGRKSRDSSGKNSMNAAYEDTKSNSGVGPFKNSQSKLNTISYKLYKSTIMPQQLNDRRIASKTTLTSRERGSFKDYCEQSTIHGLKYIGDSSLPKLERTFWMISVALALCGAASFIWHLYFKFTTSPIIISRNPASVSVDQIPFPALTICNMNNVKKSFAEQVVRGTSRKNEVQKYLLNDICNGDNKTAEPDEVLNKETEKILIHEFLLKASQSCTEMLHHCRWNGNDANCSDIFNPVYTDEGICCNFNSVKRILWQARAWHGLNITYASDEHVDWNPEYVFKKSDPPAAIPWRGHGSGVSHGLTLALDVEVDEYYCSSTASVGFKMLLHSPVESPQMREFALTLSPGKETRVIITPHITDADSAILKIAPKIRQCYFLRERRLRYYKTYTQRNCQLECEANSTLKWCNCMQYHMPVEAGIQICDQMDDECVNKVKRQMGDSFEFDEDYENDTVLVHGCNCYPGCYEIDYSTEISQSMLVASFEVGQQYFKKNPTYFERNIAIVHVFYVDSTYTKYTKSELYGFAELLSNTGGLLGLFMGFSLLSVTEIVYYVLLWIWKFVHERRKNKDLRMLAKKRDVVYPFAQ